MTQTKIEGKFYPLKNDEWLAIAKKLTHSELLVLFYIRTLDPDGEGVEIKPAAIAQSLEISRSTVSRALKVLENLGYIGKEVTPACFQLRRASK